MKKLVLGAVAALLLIAPAADAKAFRGTVVKRNVATRTVVVATKSGTLRIVHNRRDRVGTILRINGSRIKAVGRATRVHIKGVVTKHAAKSFNLSASGAVVKVRTRGHVRSARRHGHQVGNGLNVTATVSSSGAITETSSTEADDVAGAELKGTLVCTPTTNTSGTCLTPNFLMIDIGAAGTPNVIPVMFDPVLFPDALLTPLVGQPVEARASLAADPNGTSVVLTLTNISSQGTCQAEDQGDDNGGGAGGGGGGGDDAVARDHGGNSGCEDDD